MPIGYFVKNVAKSREKTYICTGVGVFMTVILCGLHTFHAFITVLCTILIVKGVGWRYVDFYSCNNFYLSLNLANIYLAVI